MLRRYRFWLVAAVIFQFLAGITHTITLFISPPPTSDQERRLMEMIDTFKPELGPWFHPTFGNLITALSSCFSFTCLLGGIDVRLSHLEAYGSGDTAGITLINLIIFGTLLVVTVCLTFIVPVTFVALIFVNLLIAYLVMPRAERRG